MLKNLNHKHILAAMLIVALIIANIPQSSAFAASGSAASDKTFIAAAQKLYYYESARKARYLAYHHKYPKYAASTVVWRVDADLDKAFYDNPVAAKNQSSLTVLVNKQHYLSSNYAPAQLTVVDGRYMRPEAAKAVKSMKSRAKKAGAKIYANVSGYRSYAVQNSLNSNTGVTQRYPDSSRARAGYSEHQTGLAIDIGSTSGNFVTYNSKEGAWLRGNAWKYGFIVRYTPGNTSITGYISEPWHVRYIGEYHARMFHAFGCKSYEEYWAKYVAHSPEGLRKIKGNWYYFSGGKAKTGWRNVKHKNGLTYKHYFNSKGVMKAGWRKISGKKYYFGGANDGKMRTGLSKISGKTYYFGSNGVMKTGWQNIFGKKYYFASNGVMATGYRTINGKRYYFNPASGASVPVYTLKVVNGTVNGRADAAYIAGTEVKIIANNAPDGKVFSGWLPNVSILPSFTYVMKAKNETLTAQYASAPTENIE
jgi:D-alanyl-D-alanine carboxypeptidase